MSVKSILKEIIENPTGKLWIQILRYLVSGGTAFLVDTGILTALTEIFGKDLLLLWSGCGFAAGLVITYLFSIRWVFDNRSISNRYAELGIFILIGVIGLGLTELFMWLFAQKIELHYLAAKILTTILVTAWNFCAKKTILFRSK